MDPAMFQSLIGFKINWNASPGVQGRSTKMFQSLIGFKINWNSIRAGDVGNGMMFQSLIGFKINWNIQYLAFSMVVVKVSIPNRV